MFLLCCLCCLALLVSTHFLRLVGIDCVDRALIFYTSGRFRRRLFLFRLVVCMYCLRCFSCVLFVVAGGVFLCVGFHFVSQVSRGRREQHHNFYFRFDVRVGGHRASCGASQRERMAGMRVGTTTCRPGENKIARYYAVRREVRVYLCCVTRTSEVLLFVRRLGLFRFHLRILWLLCAFVTDLTKNIYTWTK